MQNLNEEKKMCVWRRGGSEEDKSSEGKPKNI